MEHEPQVPNATPDTMTGAADAEAAAAPEPVPATQVGAGPAVVAPTGARKNGGARLLNVALAGALVVAVAGVAFAAGRLTAPPTVAAGAFPGGGVRIGPGADGQDSGQNGRPGGAFTGGPTIEGTVESITDTTLTIKTSSGETMQIAVDDTTTYHAQTDATADDITTGGKVLIRLDLQAGSGSGSVTSPSASDITVVP